MDRWRPRVATWECTSAVRWGKVLEDQTFDLKVGEWTAPIRTKQGFVILKVTEHQAGRNCAAEGRGTADSGGDVCGGDAAGVACLPDEAA